MTGVQRLSYGPDPSQVAELSRPEGPARGVVVVIHGGFWRSRYDLSLGRPLAGSLVSAGWAVWNLEYRRVGNGGGNPATFDDVAAGIDALADVDGLETSDVITLGHSAGGHLAVWAAGREATSRWSGARVPVTAAVAQAGVLNLAAAHVDRLGGGAVQDFLGGGVVPDDVDPTAQVPLDVPVRCVHAAGDDLVPISQSAGYVETAKASGADAELVEVDGDHFTLIDPTSPDWRRTLDVLADL
ncbi:alpha/beta hydrolase family protein [Aeromicrobium sp. CTD01-1L150]|uniref:alpha/beta hydrolase family protein n=1 Tax=Aeromicrobium sp. CTD01-1L150 TaxID=3341830 RepID=UPI0035BEC9A9